MRGASSGAAAFGLKKRTEFDPARSLITSEPVTGGAVGAAEPVDQRSATVDGDIKAGAAGNGVAEVQDVIGDASITRNRRRRANALPLRSPRSDAGAECGHQFRASLVTPSGVNEQSGDRDPTPVLWRTERVAAVLLRGGDKHLAHAAPRLATRGHATTCTATVGETAAAPEAAPTGHVTFTTDSAGSFARPGATRIRSSPSSSVPARGRIAPLRDPSRSLVRLRGTRLLLPRA